MPIGTELILRYLLELVQKELEAASPAIQAFLIEEFKKLGIEFMGWLHLKSANLGDTNAISKGE